MKPPAALAAILPPSRGTTVTAISSVLSVIGDEGDFVRVQPQIERVQDAASRRNARPSIWTPLPRLTLK